MPEALAARIQNGSSLASLSFEELEQAQANAYNQMQGKLGGYNCPRCLNRGNTMRIENHVRLLEECPCMERRRSLIRIQKSGLADELDQKTFATFQVREEWQQRAKGMAKDFAEGHTGKWFCALGSVGSGKTHLCTAICGALLERGFGVRYMRWRDDGGRIKAAVNDSGEYARLIGPLKAAQVLYIDDFFKTGKGKDITQGDINLAFELLNNRYINRNLTTIISSEWTIEEILNIDEAVGSRMFERSQGYCMKITGAGKNWRLRNG